MVSSSMCRITLITNHSFVAKNIPNECRIRMNSSNKTETLSAASGETISTDAEEGLCLPGAESSAAGRRVVTKSD